MSKYGALSRNNGHSKWFLQKTLSEHDQTMDHPWMQMIYDQSFSVKQYCAWLAMEHACFQKLEQYLQGPLVKEVHQSSLLRTAALEDDLRQLLGPDKWKTETQHIVSSSSATQLYLAHLEEDAADERLVLAHHFLQYNAVLSGGAYLGKMVSEKFAVPHGAPGVKFYAFQDVASGKEPARVQEYLKQLDAIELSDNDREAMLGAMVRVYADTELMMKECYEIQPANGIDYSAAKAAAGKKPTPPSPLPASELLELTLTELRNYTGSDGGRILMSINRELLDVSSGHEIYAPGCGYSLFAGHDVTRCLGTMSLDPEGLDDLEWEPDDAEEEATVKSWVEKLKEKYPVAGRLKKPAFQIADPPEGLRQRQQAVASKASTQTAPQADSSAKTSQSSQKCPISGKEGIGCPMAKMGLLPKSTSENETPGAAAASSKDKSGFMAGKSMVASVQGNKSSREESLIWALCPVHWDHNTFRLIAVVAICSWLSGFLFGWKLKGMTI